MQLSAARTKEKGRKIGGAKIGFGISRRSLAVQERAGQTTAA
jgi:hypothetical protein